MVRKILRYFTHTENDDFAVFVECGLDRVIKTLMSTDRESIELTINIPLPPDDLLHSVGFMHASKVIIEETNEIFTIMAPAKLSKHHKHVKYYPNQETPIWVIFMYKLEKLDEVETPFELKVNLLDTLLHSK
jgi:hypothetical protein